jgi:hypothetical protein
MPLDFTTPHRLESKPCTTEILQPWARVEVKRQPNTLAVSTIGTQAVEHAEGTILLVSDSANRCERFKVYIDDKLIGETSGEGLRDNRVCGSADECMKNGADHAYFTLPKGKISRSL